MVVVITHVGLLSLVYRLDYGVNIPGLARLSPVDGQ